MLLQAHTFLVSYCLSLSLLRLSFIMHLCFFLLFLYSLWSLSFSLWFLLLSLILNIFMKAVFPFIFKMCWYSIVFLMVFQTELKKMLRKRKVNLTFLRFSKTSLWEKRKCSGQFLFLSEQFLIQIVSIKNIKILRKIQSWSWIIQRGNKNAKLFKQPVYVRKHWKNARKWKQISSLLIMCIKRTHWKKKTRIFFFFQLQITQYPGTRI